MRLPGDEMTSKYFLEGPYDTVQYHHAQPNITEAGTKRLPLLGGTPHYTSARVSA